MNELRFQRYAQSGVNLHVETIEEIYDDLVDVSHSMHKGVRRLMQFPGSDFVMPPALTEETLPDKKFRTKLRSEQLIIARHVRIGDVARKLQLIESSTNLNGDIYEKSRRFYRFAWTGSEVLEAQMIGLSITSDAQSVAEAYDILGDVNDFKAFADELNAIGQEHGIEPEPEHGHDEIGVFSQPETRRMSELVMLEQHDVEVLLQQIERYGQGLRAQQGIDEQVA